MSTPPAQSASGHPDHFDPPRPTSGAAEQAASGTGAGGIPGPGSGPTAKRSVADVGRSILTVFGFIVAGLLALIVGWFAFGEWWIGVVRRRVDGNAFAGFGFGWMVGFVAGVASLFLLWVLLRRGMPGWARILVGAVAAVPLAPLVFSLRIAVNKANDNKGSLEYQMLTDGRGYQSGVLIGVLAAVVVFMAFAWWRLSRTRAKERERARAEGRAEEARVTAAKEAAAREAAAREPGGDAKGAVPPA